MDRRLVELGPHCGKRGHYSFYKSFKYTDNGIWRTVATDQFFFVNISASTPLCIGEMQLLWTVRNNVGDPLSSLRLYFLPEQLPDGRQHYHGENEVIATEKIVIRLSDLVTWLVSPTNESEWPVGLPWPLAQQRRTASSTATSKAGADGALPPICPVVVVSYPKYCRLMASLRRLENSPLVTASLTTTLQLFGIGDADVTSKNASATATDRGLPAVASALPAVPCESSSLAAAAVGIICGVPFGLSPKAKLVFCRSTCEHPEVEDHEFRCDYLAPNLKSRSRKKRVAAKLTESSESENDASSIADYTTVTTDSPWAAASATTDTVTQAPKIRLPRRSNGAVRSKGDGALPLVRRREGATNAELEEEESFLKSVYSFMKERGTPIHRLPCLGFKQIDLYELYKGAEKLGGYQQICQKRRWKLLYDQIGGNPTNTSAATCTRKHYERLLLPFEQHLKGQLTGSERLAVLDRQSSSPSSSSSAGLPDAETTIPEPAAVDGPADCEQPAASKWPPPNWKVAAVPAAAPPAVPSSPVAPTELGSSNGCLTSCEQSSLAAVDSRGCNTKEPSSKLMYDDRRSTTATDEEQKARLPPPPALVPQNFGPPGAVKLEPTSFGAARHHQRASVVDSQGLLVLNKFADGLATDKWAAHHSSSEPGRETFFRSPASAASRSSAAASAVVTSVPHASTALSQNLASSLPTGSDHRQLYGAFSAAWSHAATAGSPSLSTAVVGSSPAVSASASASACSVRGAITATTWQVPTNDTAATTMAGSDTAAALHPLPPGRERAVPFVDSPAGIAIQQFRPLGAPGVCGGARASRTDSPGGGSAAVAAQQAALQQPPPAHRHHSQRDTAPVAMLPRGDSPPRPAATTVAAPARGSTSAVAHLGSQSVAALHPRLSAAEAAVFTSAEAVATTQPRRQQPAHTRPRSAATTFAHLVYGFVPEELIRLNRLRFPVTLCPFRYDGKTVYGDPYVVVPFVATNPVCAVVADTSKRKHDPAVASTAGAAAASAAANGSLHAPPPPLLRGGGRSTPVHDLTCKRPRLPGGGCWTPDIRSGWFANGLVGPGAGDAGLVSVATGSLQQQQQYHNLNRHRSLSASHPSRKLLHSPSTEAESQLAASTAAAGRLGPAAGASGHQTASASNNYISSRAGRSTESCSSSLLPSSTAGDMSTGAAAIPQVRPLAPRSHVSAPSLLAVAPSLLLQQPPWSLADISPHSRPAFAAVDSRSSRRAAAAMDASEVDDRSQDPRSFSAVIDRHGRSSMAASTAAASPFQDPYAAAAAAAAAARGAQHQRTSYELLANAGQVSVVPHRRNNGGSVGGEQ